MKNSLNILILFYSYNKTLWPRQLIKELKGSFGYRGLESMMNEQRRDSRLPEQCLKAYISGIGGNF